MSIFNLGEHLVPINEIHPYGKNPKVHPDKQIKLLANHIKHVGFDTPIVVDEHGVILKGHGRLLALKYLGQTEALIKVKSGLSEAQKKAARIADNKLAELADDHEEYLRAELKELAELEVDLKALGFDNVRLTELKVDIIGLNKDDDEKADEKADEVPEVPQNVMGVERGDLWLLGPYLECDGCGGNFVYNATLVDADCPTCQEAG